jgi:hypothetical protein
MKAKGKTSVLIPNSIQPKFSLGSTFQDIV